MIELLKLHPSPGEQYRHPRQTCHSDVRKCAFLKGPPHLVQTSFFRACSLVRRCRRGRVRARAIDLLNPPAQVANDEAKDRGDQQHSTGPFAQEKENKTENHIEDQDPHSQPAGHGHAGDQQKTGRTTGEESRKIRAPCPRPLELEVEAKAVQERENRDELAIRKQCDEEHHGLVGKP